MFQTRLIKSPKIEFVTRVIHYFRNETFMIPCLNLFYFQQNVRLHDHAESDAQFVSFLSVWTRGAIENSQLNLNYLNSSAND